MGSSERPPKPAAQAHRNYFYRTEAAQALGVKPWRVLEFEKEGKLVPARDGKGARRYPKSAVAKLAAQLATVAPKAGVLEADILERIDAGESDTQIVKALRVPLATVRALRGAATGQGRGDDDDVSAPAASSDSPEARAWMHQAEVDLETERKRIYAALEQRRKEEQRRR